VADQNQRADRRWGDREGVDGFGGGRGGGGGTHAAYPDASFVTGDAAGIVRDFMAESSDRDHKAAGE
jgi:hypothetical protein